MAAVSGPVSAATDMHGRPFQRRRPCEELGRASGAGAGVLRCVVRLKAVRVLGEGGLWSLASQPLFAQSLATRAGCRSELWIGALAWH